MKITKREKYTLIEASDESLSGFYTQFNKQYAAFENQHLIIVVTDLNELNVKVMNTFEKFSTLHRDNGTSFVMVCDSLAIDQLEETLNVVPTLLEAEDIIEMDAIERDLGF